MPTTPNLQLSSTDLAAPGFDPRAYTARLDADTNLDASLSKVDVFAGSLTGSLVSVFSLGSSSVSDFLASSTPVTGVMGAEYTRVPMIFQEIVAFAAQSGSGGVTRIDVRVPDSNGTFNSIFGNNAFKLALSSSAGNYGVARASTFRTSSWSAYTVAQVVVETAAGAAGGGSGQYGLFVHVFAKPSGSYGT
jgi:hypothetical protein